MPRQVSDELAKYRWPAGDAITRLISRCIRWARGQNLWPRQSSKNAIMARQDSMARSGSWTPMPAWYPSVPPVAFAGPDVRRRGTPSIGG